MNENYDEWLNKEADDQIRDLMMSKDQEDRKEVEQRKRMEKAKARRKLWKEWRWRNEAADDDDERDQVIDDEGLKEHEGSKEHAEEVLHQGEAVGEPPGQGNSLHKAGVLPEILGGEEPGWGGAYEEASIGGTAPCKAGPHIHPDVDLPSKDDEEEPTLIDTEESREEEEEWRMEILLGMTQEEGVPCLLCLMPRCLCHITLDLTKIDLRIRKLEGGEETQSQEPPGKDEADAERAVDRGLLGEGGLGGPLES